MPRVTQMRGGVAGAEDVVAGGSKGARRVGGNWVLRSGASSRRVGCNSSGEEVSVREEAWPRRGRWSDFGG